MSLLRSIRMLPSLLLLFSLLFCPSLSVPSSPTRHPIKINAGPSPLHSSPPSASPARSGRWTDPRSHKPTLQRLPALSRPPSNFSLPPPLLSSYHDSEGQELDLRFTPPYDPSLWHHLDGQCYSITLPPYTYTFCPFHNLTQTQSNNNFQAVLGIWNRWSITPHLHLAMNYTDGTPCNEHVNRSTVVTLVCSSTAPLPLLEVSERVMTRVKSVKEPSVCQYEVEFDTPLVCELYQQVRNEGQWRKAWNEQHPMGTVGKMKRRRDTEEGEEEREQRQMEEDRRLMTLVDELEGQAAGERVKSEEVQGMLRCIKAMTVEGATRESYAAVCASYLQALSEGHESDGNDEVGDGG